MIKHPYFIALNKTPCKFCCVGFVVLIAVAVVAGLIAGVVVKNHQISMALMVFYSLGNSLLSSR